MIIQVSNSKDGGAMRSIDLGVGYGATVADYWKQYMPGEDISRYQVRFNGNAVSMSTQLTPDGRLTIQNAKLGAAAAKRKLRSAIVVASWKRDIRQLTPWATGIIS